MELPCCRSGRAERVRRHSRRRGSIHEHEAKLSDSLVNVVDDFTMTMNKQKISGRNAGLLVKRDGKWMWKTMVEAGWGGMSSMPAEGKK